MNLIRRTTMNNAMFAMSNAILAVWFFAPIFILCGFCIWYFFFKKK